MIKVEGKHIVVIGAALSGIGAALLLKEKGADIFVSDFGRISEGAKQRLQQASIPFEEENHSGKAKNGAFAVVSPGVPNSATIVQYYLNAGKKVYSEIEVASWFTDREIVAVTGSNGKTTVSTWLMHTWETAGRDCSLAGNIGYAFSEKVLSGKGEVLLEVSSFQLENIWKFKPSVSVILNITPDHLNRYDYNLEAYAAAKFRITENQDAEDTFIYNFDDPLITDHLNSLKKKDPSSKAMGFFKSERSTTGCFYPRRRNHFQIQQ